NMDGIAAYQENAVATQSSGRIIVLLYDGAVRFLRQAVEAMAAGDYATRVTATSRDEVGDLARSFNSMAAQLEAVEQQRREFVATVSHDLRTPIAALRANLENIIDGVSEADDVSLGQMLRQTERLGRMVSQLLDLSRLESGADPFERTSITVVDLFADIERELHLTAPDQKLTVTVEPHDLWLAGDGDRLHQLLVNLVDNARKVSPPEAPVELRARLEGDDVRMEVEDRGPGIPVEQRDLVFDRFHRADPARGGTGCLVVIDLPIHQEPS
ncbi:MAG: sensor histidine kinase, partial [Acidimicrobiales bacterium]